MPRFDSMLRQQRLLPCVNTGSETIPPFACVYNRYAGYESDYIANGSDIDIIYEVEKPSEISGESYQMTVFPGSNGSKQVFARGALFGFNSHVAIPPNRTGAFTLDLPAIGLCGINSEFLDIAGGSQHFVLPAANQWELEDCDLLGADFDDTWLFGIFRRRQILGHFSAGENKHIAMITRASWGGN